VPTAANAAHWGTLTSNETPLLTVQNHHNQAMQDQVSAKPAHFPGFDGLRLVAAIAVMFSHAFLVATGSEESEPLVRLLGPDNILGLYGVYTFFIISGFLLARSLASRPSAITYAVNRTLRILPGFVLCTAIVASLIGPLFSSLSVAEYFLSRETRTFVTLSLNSLGDVGLPGLFAYDGGKLALTVNGSLWSLKYEALSYLLLLTLWTVMRSGRFLTAVIAAFALLTWVSPAVAHATAGVAYTLPFFAAGVVMHWIDDRYGTNALAAGAACVVLVLAAAAGLQKYAFAIAGAYLIVFFGARRNVGSTIANTIGDCSYGLYLYGWPAEQIVKQITRSDAPWRIFALSLPLAFGLALISCHLVERPAMRWRGAVAGGLKARVAAFGVDRPPAIAVAKIVFVVGVTLLLLSEKQWWYFGESMIELLLAVIAAAVVARLFSRAEPRLHPTARSADELEVA
jgi:peptidoglycan/LPS O-acetylase OafA/YrhL